MKYILQKSGYAFEKIPERRIAAKLIGDGGLDGADGGPYTSHRLKAKVTQSIFLTAKTHQRQRRLMDPAFGTPVVKAFFPSFIQYAETVRLQSSSMTFIANKSVSTQLCAQWTQLVDNSSDGTTCVVNVARGLSCATVDTVCDGAVPLFSLRENSSCNIHSIIWLSYWVPGERGQ